MAMGAYLARLLFEDRELLDSGLYVCLESWLNISMRSEDGGDYGNLRITWANCSASGSCLSTSLEKSFSGLNAASAMMCSVCDVWMGYQTIGYRGFGGDLVRDGISCC